VTRNSTASNRDDTPRFPSVNREKSGSQGKSETRIPTLFALSQTKGGKGGEAGGGAVWDPTFTTFTTFSAPGYGNCRFTVLSRGQLGAVLPR